MLRITSDKKIGVMDKNNAPAAYCEIGDIVVFETLDCTDGAVSRDGKRDWTKNKYTHNPATGPLYVKGAKKGDVLKVTILDIKTAEWGFMGSGFGRDCFKNFPGTYKIKAFEFSDGKVHIGNKTLQVSPMIGVIGVAPEGDGINTTTPYDHGGNMDCTVIGKGAEVYFPVNTDGALLAMGDLHAIMGDGEVFQYGLEVAGEVTVKVEVMKNDNDILKMPAVVRDGKFYVISSAETLDECSRLAVEQMYRILINYGWDETEAGYLMSMKCDLAVCQTVDPKLTVRASLPTEVIKA